MAVEFWDVVADYGNVKVATLGDSEMQKATTASGLTSVSSSMAGMMTFVSALDPRFAHTSWIDAADVYGRGFSGANFGVSGDVAASILARATAALNTKPNVLIADGGFNDCTTGLRTADAVAADLVAIMDACVDRGVAFIYMAIWPPATAVWAASSDSRYMAANINEQMRYECAKRPRCIFLEKASVMADLTSAALSTVPKTNYVQSDGTHGTVRSNFYQARDLVLPALQALFPPRSGVQVPSPDHIYHATKNPYGLLTTSPYTSSNPYLRGTTGTIGTGTTGSAATSLTVQRAAGTGSAVASKNADGSQRIVFTPPASGNDTWYARFGNFTHGLAAGTWVRAYAKVTLSAWDGFIGVPLECGNMDSGGVQLSVGKAVDVNDPSGDDGGLLPAENMTLYLATPPIQITDAAGQLRIRLAPQIRGGKSGTGTMDLIYLAAAPVRDPRPFWNY